MEKRTLKLIEEADPELNLEYIRIIKNKEERRQLQRNGMENDFDRLDPC